MSPPAGFLGPDREALAAFVGAAFAHAEEGGYVSIRAFFDDALARKRGDPPFKRVTVRLNGGGLGPVVDAAFKVADAAARAGRPVVVAPPIATFTSGTAGEKNLLEGLVLTVELDERAPEALATLRAVLGPPTIVVASGGTWTDPATGEVQDKLHVHWRLVEPAVGPEEHAKLKRARTLACDLVGADGTAKPIVHPLRWAGTVHRKNPDAPRLARIVEHNPDAEVILDDALAELEGMAVLRGMAAGEGGRRAAGDGSAPAELLAGVARLLPNPLPPRPGTLDAAPRGSWDDWNRIGMAFWRAGGGGEAAFVAFDEWSRKSPKHDAAETRARWEHYATSPPTTVGAHTLVYEARLVDPAFRRRRPDPPPRPEEVEPFGAGAAPSASGDGVEPAPAGDAPLDLSHDGLALGLAQEWATGARHVALWGKWLFWDGAKWVLDEVLLHLTRTREYLRRRADGLVRAAEAEEVEGLSVAQAEVMAKTLRSAQTVAHVAGLARSDRALAATTAMWDADPWALNTPGGIVDLKTGELRPPDPLALCTKSTAVAPGPRGTPTPLWDAFLERVFRHDPELVGFMRRMLGYGLTGDVSEHVVLFAWGQGGNGKGALLNTVSRLLGDYAGVAPTDLLLATQGDRHPTDMAMLRGARFVTAQEMPAGRAWDEPKLKSLSGGDPITARFMRQDFFTYEPQFKLFVSSNHKPSFRNVNEAIRRRIRLAPFLQNIPPAERDKALPDKLKAEWPGILRWMIEGCLEWQRVGLCPPASVVEASEEYLAAEDVLGQWLEERTVASHTIDFTMTAALYGDWREWNERNGQPAGSAKAFSQRLTERGFKSNRRGAGMSFVGIGLRARWEPDQDEEPPSEGCEGPSHIDRNARAQARTHTHTSHKERPFTSFTEAADDDEVEL